jgi:hypothetical protein
MIWRSIHDVAAGSWIPDDERRTEGTPRVYWQDRRPNHAVILGCCMNRTRIFLRTMLVLAATLVAVVCGAPQAEPTSTTVGIVVQA